MPVGSFPGQAKATWVPTGVKLLDFIQRGEGGHIIFNAVILTNEVTGACQPAAIGGNVGVLYVDGGSVIVGVNGAKGDDALIACAIGGGDTDSYTFVRSWIWRIPPTC